MISTHISCDHNTYHIRFRDTWLQREKEATRPFTFQPKALEMFENQYKSELLIRSHPRGRGFESLQVHQNENRPKGRFSFCRGPAGVEVYPPLAGEIPSGPPKINHPQGWLYFFCALPTRCLTVRPVALCPALWYTAHSYPHIAFIKEDCLCLQCWSAATGGST